MRMYAISSFVQVCEEGHVDCACVKRSLAGTSRQLRYDMTVTVLQMFSERATLVICWSFAANVTA